MVEEHSALGGLGEGILALLAARGVHIPMRALGVPDEVIEHGKPAEILAEMGLDAVGIEGAARELLGR